MRRTGWFMLAGFILLMLAIAVGGPYTSKLARNHYRKNIEANGAFTKAVISGKNTHKGNSVIFKYSFKDRNYKNREQSNYYFEELLIGDTVTILLDSTHPFDSYIHSH